MITPSGILSPRRNMYGSEAVSTNFVFLSRPRAVAWKTKLSMSLPHKLECTASELLKSKAEISELY